MTVQEFLTTNTALLAAHGIATARLDCLVLLEDGLNTNRTHLLAYPEQIIPDETLKAITQKVQQRAQRIPLAYIRGHAEFYGRTFMVNEDVLVPRPESEAIIDLAKNQPQAKNTTAIVDIGTGSGALAITAKCLFPDANVIATDIDAKCLSIARRNAATHKADINFGEGHLLEAVSTNILKGDALLLCNLPYVPTQYPINHEAAHEPAKALFAGDDGLDLYRELFQQLRTSSTTETGCTIITESLHSQHHTLAEIAAANGFTLVQTEGLAQRFVHHA